MKEREIHVDNDIVCHELSLHNVMHKVLSPLACNFSHFPTIASPPALSPAFIACSMKSFMNSKNAGGGLGTRLAQLNKGFITK